MFILACEACKHVVFSDCTGHHPGISRTMNALQIPTPCCGAPTMWDGVSTPDPMSEAEIKAIAMSSGWRWANRNGLAGGLYNLNREDVPPNKKLHCDVRAVHTFLDPPKGRAQYWDKDWWMQHLLQCALGGRMNDGRRRRL